MSDAPFSYLVPPGETFGLSERQIHWLRAQNPEIVDFALQAYRTFGAITIQRLELTTDDGRPVSYDAQLSGQRTPSI